MKKSFEDLIIIADRLAAGQNRLKDTILKEVLHANILLALQKSELGKSLVLQGGTALRLCYGNQRYSEDLNFVRNMPLNPTHFEHFKETLKASLAEKFALSVRVSDPKRSMNERTTAKSVAVHRWIATIEIEKEGTRNQKLHIEIADIPAYDARPRMINSLYSQFGAGAVVLNVSSEREILADKVIAIAGRRYIKARDIWDIKWLRDKGIDLHHGWVRSKAADYHLIDGGDIKPLIDRLNTRINDLASTETHRKFKQEMRRFLAKEQSDQWLKDDITSSKLLMDVSDFLEDQLPRLQTPTASSQKSEALSDEDRIRQWRDKKNKYSVQNTPKT